MIEIWKDIKGFEGFYQVSNLGRIKRLSRYTEVKTRYGTRPYCIEEKILEPFTWQSRYLRVDILYKRNKVTHRRATYVHTLVAEAFLGNRPEGYVIDHIDGNYLNNNASNLRYVTQKENMQNILPETKERRINACKNNTWCKGRRYLSKDGSSKMVKPEDIDEYLNNGWEFGFETARHRKRDKKGKFI